VTERHTFAGGDPAPAGRVLVTGATGHVGAQLVRALLDDGRLVRALVREDRRALAGLPVETVRGDVRDPQSVLRALEGVEVVYHLAALISLTGEQGGRVRAVNVAGTRAVVESCLARGVSRLVHFSSIHALSPFPRGEALDERRAAADARRAPAYDRSKAAGEREVAAGVARGLSATIVLPTAVLGPFDFKPSRMGRVLLDLAEGRLPALVGGAFDWVDGRDVARAAIAAERAGRPGERYLLSGTFLPLTELAALVADVSGVRAPRVVVPQWLARPVAPAAAAWARLTGSEPRFTPDSLLALRTGHPRIDHSRATVELEYCPRPLRETVRDTLAWFATQGRLSPPAARAAL
jgi:dihydroflavonol-4-reductase